MSGMVCMKGVLEYEVERRAMHTLVPGIGTEQLDQGLLLLASSRGRASIYSVEQ